MPSYKRRQKLNAIIFLCIILSVAQTNVLSKLGTAIICRTMQTYCPSSYQRELRDEPILISSDINLSTLRSDLPTQSHAALNSSRMKPQVNTTTKTNHEESKLVLFWSMFFGKTPIYKTGDVMFKSRCPSKDHVHPCYLTYDRSLLNASDVIMLHAVDLHLNSSDIPPHRLPHQIWVLYGAESPAYFPVDPKFNGAINLTFTYRTDADVNFIYGRVRKRKAKERIVPATLPNVYTSLNNSKLVVWLISNCKSKSRRRDYAFELQKHISVDVYGRCSNQSCGNKRTTEGQKLCERTIRDYLFYLAFENSLCADYVTEKAYRALYHGLIPVVLGHSNYTKFLPPNSYIDVRDFRSPKELADHLKDISTNDSLYQKYTSWRKYYSVERNGYWFCELCHYLYTHQGLKDKYYTNISKWWNGVCSTPETFYKGHFDLPTETFDGIF